MLSGVVAQRASAPLADRFAACCAQWLRGADARLRRAAAQALGLLAGVEGVRFGRRVPPLLTPLLATLRQQPDQVLSFYPLHKPWVFSGREVPMHRLT